MQDRDIQHVLVVGCPRSGTTLLQSLIASHPDVFSAPETHFFIDAVGQRAERLFDMPARSWRERRIRLIRRCRVALGVTNVRSCRRRLSAFVTEVGRPDLVASIPRWPVRLDASARLFVALGDRIARQKGKRLWLEKTPGHLHYLDTIERFMPGVKVICLLRSAPDNIASMMDVARRYPERWDRKYRTIDGCIARWLASARAAERQAGRTNRLLLSYEDLAGDPVATMARVGAFLGLGYPPHMLDARAGVYQQIVRDREPHKASVQGRIEPRNGTKFKQMFTPQEQALILTRLGDWPERMRVLCERAAAMPTIAPVAAGRLPANH